MPKRLIVAVFLLVSFAPLHGLSQAASDSERVLKRAEDHFNNGEYDKARPEYELYMKLSPKDPVGCWRTASNEYSRLRVEQGNTNEPRLNDLEYAQSIAFMGKCIAMCEEKIGAGESVYFYLFVEAAIYSIKGLLEKGSGHPNATLDSGRTMLELARRSKYQDAQFLPGLLGYDLGSRPWYQRLVAKFLGLPADRKDGLKLLGAAIKDNHNPFSDDIRFLVFHILTDKKIKEKDAVEAEKILGVTRGGLARELFAKYPRRELLKKYLDSIDGKRTTAP